LSVKRMSFSKLNFLLSGTLTWLVTALILCLSAAAVLSGIKLDMRTIGYTSSALSFVSAAAAGIAAMRRRKSKALLTGLITGSVLSALLLIIGFMIGGTQLDGLISTVAFTISGAMVGSVFCPAGRKRKK